MKKMTRKHGFTLIELLVVIAIIALLMSILMPSLAKVKKQAQAVACGSNGKQLSLALEMYLGDNKNTYPLGWVNGATSFGEDLWYVALKPYYKDKKVLICPSTSDRKTGTSGVYKCPADPFTIGVMDAYWKINEQYSVSYIVNGYCQSFENAANYQNKWKTANQKNSNNIPVLTDGAYFFQSRTINAYDNPPPYEGAGGSAGSGIGWNCIDRHSGYVTALFMDNSYRKVGLKELWTLKWSKVFNTRGPWTVAGGVSAGYVGVRRRTMARTVQELLMNGVFF